MENFFFHAIFRWTIKTSISQLKEKKRKCRNSLIWRLWPLLPAEWEEAFWLQRLSVQRVEAQRTVPNGYGSGFPLWITCFKKLRLDQCFFQRKGPFFYVMHMGADRKLAGTKRRLCAEVHSRSHTMQALASARHTAVIRTSQSQTSYLSLQSWLLTPPFCAYRSSHGAYLTN